MKESALARKTETTVVDTEKQELLLFLTSGARRSAVALSSVNRLEEFKLEQFERAGQKLVVQYRGELLPIVNLSDKFDAAKSGDAEDMLKVLVCSHRGERMGVVVDQILDVAHESFNIEQRFKDAQSQGSAVIQKQVTDFLDLATMLDSAKGSGFFSQTFEPAEAIQ
jgi:two-component system chemotaxis sensor kinase CheA